jgi:fumarate reductase flavoprotein subunit
MAGLCAAARSRELGAEPLVLEKGDRPGGSMLLSSGVVWRYRTLDAFQAECPGGDPALQAQIIERLDEGIAWLESLGARVSARATGNVRTVGMRFDPRRLTDALVRAAGEVQTGEALRPGPGNSQEPLVLATGGFSVRLARERGLLLRANRWSEGDGLDFAQRRGAAIAGDLEEFYGRAMPAPPVRIEETDFVRLAQVYGRFASVTDEDGQTHFEGEPSWSETDLVQAIGSWPGGRAWYTVGPDALRQRVRDRTVADLVEAARAAGARIRDEPPRVSVLVQAGVTQTLSGLKIDERARVLRGDGSVVDGLYAAGADVGGISNGGWSSGLAAALVFGRIAAEEALS